MPDEMPALIAAINAEESPYIRAFFWLRLLLGTRRTELLRVKWDDVSLERRTLKLLEAKANRPDTFALAPEPVAILEALPKMLGNPHVFPSPKRPREHLDSSEQGKRIRERVTVQLWAKANPYRATELRQAATTDNEYYSTAFSEIKSTGGKLWDVRGHDLRRTLGSWRANEGESLLTIGNALNHADSSTTEICARIVHDTQRKTLEAHATQLVAVAGVKPVL
jgi:integrase